MELNEKKKNPDEQLMASENKEDGDSEINEDLKSKDSIVRKKNKGTKKGTKLDAKSKLEKSRQSARECRARKKLRYQYLEDLVNSREKAVVKLRKELAMFNDLSKQEDITGLNQYAKSLYSSSCFSSAGGSECSKGAS